MHAGAIDNCDNIIQSHRETVFCTFFADISYCLSNRNGFTDTGSLDNDIIILFCDSQLSQLRRQILSQCAADAAIGQRNKIAVLLGHNASSCDKISVNIDFTDIIYNDRCTDSFVITENMI